MIEKKRGKERIEPNQSSNIHQFDFRDNCSLWIEVLCNCIKVWIRNVNDSDVGLTMDKKRQQEEEKRKEEKEERNEGKKVESRK